MAICEDVTTDQDRTRGVTTKRLIITDYVERDEQYAALAAIPREQVAKNIGISMEQFEFNDMVFGPNWHMPDPLR